VSELIAGDAGSRHYHHWDRGRGDQALGNRAREPIAAACADNQQRRTQALGQAGKPARDICPFVAEGDRPIASLLGPLDTDRKNRGLEAISDARRHRAGAVRALGPVGPEQERTVNRVTKCLVVQLVRNDEYRTWTRSSKRSRHAAEEGARKNTTSAEPHDQQIGLPALGQRRETFVRLPKHDNALCGYGTGAIRHLRQYPHATCDRLTSLQLLQSPIAVRKDGRVRGNVHKHELAAELGRKRRSKRHSGNSIVAVNADDDWTCHFRTS
jgi:hypothetical protein